MKTGIAIIRLKDYSSNAQAFDIKKITDLGVKGARFWIPTVKVYQGKIHSRVIIDHKPLLLSYGFLELPTKVLANKELLIAITRVSEVVSGFFYRHKEDIARDLSLYGEAYSLTRDTGIAMREIFHKPILVKLVSQDQVNRLYEVAESRAALRDLEKLEVGSYLTLKTYPFEGLGAIVLDKISHSKIRLELVDSNIIITINTDDLVYSLDPEEYLFNA